MRYSLCYDIENFLNKVIGRGFNQVTERYLHRLFDETKVVPKTLTLRKAYTEEGEKLVFSAKYGNDGRVDVWIDNDNFDVIKEINIFANGELVSISRSYCNSKDIERDYHLIVSFYDSDAFKLVTEGLGSSEEIPRVISVDEFEEILVHDSITSYDISGDTAIRDSSAIPSAEKLIEQMHLLYREQNVGKEPKPEKEGYSSNLNRLFNSKGKGM